MQGLGDPCVATRDHFILKTSESATLRMGHSIILANRTLLPAKSGLDSSPTAESNIAEFSWQKGFPENSKNLAVHPKCSRVCKYH